jgi:hypothetical protein
VSRRMLVAAMDTTQTRGRVGLHHGGVVRRDIWMLSPSTIVRRAPDKPHKLT